ncbi:methyltransferase [Echinimonas agarilytica]|uniref:Ribosomal RNA large subunit methyltransferase G n=1 Tax=Echinimonas agarilytica TaxID=1215918 RepID=A0AA41W906_9GAMM|nr:methyltransferase [Echinimonas agarilytica]MCM2680556.1 methyltransferase [Echinimonas agarilytica]
MYSPLNLSSPVLELARYPLDKRETLLPFDAADELIMDWWLNNPESAQQLCFINDGFGALSCFFAQQSEAQLVHISDSFLAQQAAMNNMSHNQLDEQRISYKDCSDEWPEAPNRIIIKVPKSLALFEYQLARISELPEGTPVLIASRLKDLPAKAVKLLKDAFGNVVPELARRKSRIMHAQVSGDIQPRPEPTRWDLPAFELTLENQANVFSRKSLDIGTRFLLQHLPKTYKPKKVIDLGCGNGILALAMARRYPDNKYVLVDESHMAIESARQNQQSNLPELSDKFTFLCQHGLVGFWSESADLVLCNPPFHQQQAVTDEIAWQMFNQAKNALRTGGKLRVVANRHLGYHVKMKRIFGDVEILASNSKFVILESRKADKSKHVVEEDTGSEHESE